jgi:hypothetical protein
MLFKINQYGKSTFFILIHTRELRVHVFFDPTPKKNKTLNPELSSLKLDLDMDPDPQLPNTHTQAFLD